MQYISNAIVTAHPQKVNNLEGYAISIRDGDCVYNTWMGKAAFEATHIPVGDVSLELPWKQRLVAEHQQLAVRLEKLNKALESFHIEDDLLFAQAQAMQVYLDILDKRLEQSK